MKFYSPYQFISFSAPNSDDLKPYKKIQEGETPYIRHDRWDEGSYSGRIICELTTISPLVVGARQDPGEKADKKTGAPARPGVIYPYRDGQAIPANSLRGMIGSVAEAISNSAMRVLSKKEAHDYFVRKSKEEALRKIGVLIKDGEDYYIYPLSGTHYRINCNDAAIINEQCYQHYDNPKFVTATLDNSWATLSSNGRKGILYIRGNHPSMPNKQHETFIPWEGELDKCTRISLDAELVHGLDAELKKRYKSEENFPHQPKGYIRDWKSENAQLVKNGDVIYYDKEKSGITELSYSAIWRRPVGNLYDAVDDKNLLPWSQRRDSLTPAEALFGVVEDDSDRTPRNLASRLRFYDAESTSPVTDIGEMTLKILASPKPPSPSMYFRSKNGSYISKSKFRIEGNSNPVPNGRKRYLIHPDWENKIKKNDKAYFEWQTQDEDNQATLNQKLRCKPIPEKASFQFYIDFENMSEDELGLLQKAITPAATFQHQLGLGKPLGLGQVTIGITDIHFIDRKRRYSPEGLKSSRYHNETQIGSTPPNSPGTDRFIDPAALKAICQIGNRESYETDSQSHCLPIRYPFIGNNKDNEGKGYEWFMKNENAQKPQRLRKPSPSRKLPPLDSDTTNPDISPPASLNQKRVKIGGLPNQWRTMILFEDIITSIRTEYPTFSSPEKGDRDNEIKVEISSSDLIALSNKREFLPLKVRSKNKDFDLTLQFGGK